MTEKTTPAASNYGTVTTGFGTAQQRELPITDFVQANYVNNRVISVMGINGESIVASVENPESSGRNPKQVMYLSRESFVGLLSTGFLYFSCKGESLEDLLKEAVQKQAIEYNYSDNLGPVGKL
ncbi:hypothetical protein [Hymenobacter koreensis]|uniref:Uncharacterized protein n=1 Tax=Hymenobacter koreensis TaxID=1084523 RepID=A0ABP8JJZ6_9BACT